MSLWDGEPLSDADMQVKQLAKNATTSTQGLHGAGRLVQGELTRLCAGHRG